MNSLPQSEQPFSERLRAWMGDWTHKEASQALGVEIRTFQQWLYGKTEPHRQPSMREIEQRMKETARE